MRREYPAFGSRHPAWRSFERRQGRAIERQLRSGQPPCCPGCRELLEAAPASRFRDCLVLDATAYDLDCRDCRRFWCVVRHTPRSLRLLRMRRLVAAVRAIGRAPRRRHPAGRQRLPVSAPV